MTGNKFTGRLLEINTKRAGHAPASNFVSAHQGKAA